MSDQTNPHDDNQKDDLPAKTPEEHHEGGDQGHALVPASPPDALPPVSFTVKDLATADWTEEQLMQEAGRRWNAILSSVRKMAIDTFRLGAALAYFHKPLKERRQWTKYLAEINLPPTTVWRAIQLYEAAKVEGNVANFTINQAYKAYGIQRDVDITAIDVKALTHEESEPDTKADDATPDTTAEDHKKKYAKKKHAKKKDGAKKKDSKKPAPVASEEKGVIEFQGFVPDDDEEDQDSGYEEEDDGSAPSLVLEEFARRNQWDEQQQLQLLVAFWKTHLKDTLLATASGEELREFLTEQGTKPPPPKDWPYHTLMMTGNRLQNLCHSIKAIDWNKESVSSDDYRMVLEDIVMAVRSIEECLPKSQS
jgi:hypothetical protein